MTSDLKSSFEEFKRGIMTPLESLKLMLDHPNLMGYFIMPMAITLIASACFIYALLIGFWGFLKVHAANLLGQYFNSVGPVLLVILTIFALYGLFINFTLLLSFASSPFNDILANATEKTQGAETAPQSWMHFIPLFFLDLRKTILALALSVLFWGESLIPVFGLLSWLGFALIQTFVMITYPQNRRGAGVAQSLLWIKNHFFRSLGFGLMTQLLFMIPFANVFALPLSVVGGTLLFLDNKKPA